MEGGGGGESSRTGDAQLARAARALAEADELLHLPKRGERRVRVRVRGWEGAMERALLARRCARAHLHALLAPLRPEHWLEELRLLLELLALVPAAAAVLVTVEHALEVARVDPADRLLPPVELDLRTRGARWHAARWEGRGGGTRTSG